jgi:topoisomerase-4 subunit A
MSSWIGRWLNIADGLKPGTKPYRLCDECELGLKSTAKPKKSALRTVGDAAGTIRTASACYEAMVFMAQPFSYRYPPITGQGKLGSPDDLQSLGHAPYGSKRCPLANTLLAELGKVPIEDN